MSESNDQRLKLSPARTAADESPETGALSVYEPIRQKVESELKPLLQSGRPPNVPQLLERVNAVILNVAQEFFHGPLPHPSHFEHYEKAVPGSAEWIIKSAETEQTHRHAWENRSLNFEFIYSMAGMVCGFLIAIILIGAGIYVTLAGHDTVGGLFVGVGAIGMVTSFIKGRDRKQQPPPPPSVPATKKSPQPKQDRRSKRGR